MIFFFRGHISDYLWYNTRDPWVELSDLYHISSERNYYNLRYMQSRYFRSQNSLDRAAEEAGAFNVLRRLDSDGCCILILDDKDSAVALGRSKASLWIRRNKGNESGTLGQSRYG